MFQAQCATRSAATRSVAQRAHATHARRAHNATVHTLLWTRNCARTARCVHGLHCTMYCAQPCCFCLEFLLCCVSRDPGGSLLLFSTQWTGCSRRTPPSKRRLRRRLESCAKLARLVDWISLGLWLRMWRMSLLIWNSRLYLRILWCDLPYLSVLLSFILLPLCPHLPLLSRFLPPFRLWSFRLRSSVGKATAKRVRSRKLE